MTNDCVRITRRCQPQRSIVDPPPPPRGRRADYRPVILRLIKATTNIEREGQYKKSVVVVVVLTFKAAAHGDGRCLAVFLDEAKSNFSHVESIREERRNGTRRYSIDLFNAKEREERINQYVTSRERERKKNEFSFLSLSLHADDGRVCFQASEHDTSCCARVEKSTNFSSTR